MKIIHSNFEAQLSADDIIELLQGYEGDNTNLHLVCTAVMEARELPLNKTHKINVCVSIPAKGRLYISPETPVTITVSKA